MIKFFVRARVMTTAVEKLYALYEQHRQTCNAVRRFVLQLVAENCMRHAYHGKYVANVFQGVARLEISHVSDTWRHSVLATQLLSECCYNDEFHCDDACLVIGKLSVALHAAVKAGGDGGSAETNVRLRSDLILPLAELCSAFCEQARAVIGVECSDLQFTIDGEHYLAAAVEQVIKSRTITFRFRWQLKQ
jgi:hypothetical protein